MARGNIRAANITGSGPQIETWVLGSGIHVPFSALRAMNDAGTDAVDLKANSSGHLRVNVENTALAIAEPVDVNIVSGGGGAGGDVNVTNFPSVQAVSGPLTDAQLRATPINAIDRFSGGTSARKTITAAGTPEQLLTASTPCLAVKIIALADNGGRIMVGFTNAVRAATSTYNGVEALYAEDSVIVNIDNANKVWIDTTVSGNGVSYTPLT